MSVNSVVVRMANGSSAWPSLPEFSTFDCYSFQGGGQKLLYLFKGLFKVLGDILNNQYDGPE